MTTAKNRFANTCAFCTTIAIGALSIVTLAVLFWVATL